MIDAWRHGELSSEQFKLLERKLDEDTELRSSFIALAILEDGLYELGQKSDGYEMLNFKEESKKETQKHFLVGAMVASLILGFCGWLYFQEAGQVPLDNDADHYSKITLPLLSVGKSSGEWVSTSTWLNQDVRSEINLKNGATIEIDGPGTIGLHSESAGVFYEGSLTARMDTEDSTFAVETAEIRFLDLGTEFSVRSIDNDMLEVDVLDGEIELQSRNRIPKYFWNFDNPSDSLQLGKETKSVDGLIGAGALAFINDRESYARILGQTGKYVGSGEMSFSTGLSIETLFSSNWSTDGYDEFFRKEDGNHRILLSFQNDENVGGFDYPEVPIGPKLSFGLYLDGFGYQELDMPLDGKQGRPTVREISNGQVWHLVAMYDSFTGRKSLWLDGKEVFGCDYPVGTLILSGGPHEAVIGNHLNIEPFTGIIDEMALYSFALNKEEIEKHFNNVNQGLPYFGSDDSITSQLSWLPLRIYEAGWKLHFNRLSGKLVHSSFIPL